MDFRGRGPALCNLLKTDRVFRGIEYRIDGLVQLLGTQLQSTNSPVFSNEIPGISLERPVTRLHFLRGTTWRAPDGTRIGSFVIHFANETQIEIPIIYGDHIRDWRVREIGRPTSSPDSLR